MNINTVNSRSVLFAAPVGVGDPAQDAAAAAQKAQDDAYAAVDTIKTLIQEATAAGDSATYIQFLQGYLATAKTNALHALANNTVVVNLLAGYEQKPNPDTLNQILKYTGYTQADSKQATDAAASAAVPSQCLQQIQAIVDACQTTYGQMEALYQKAQSEGLSQEILNLLQAQLTAAKTALNDANAQAAALKNLLETEPDGSAAMNFKIAFAQSDQDTVTGCQQLMQAIYQASQDPSSSLNGKQASIEAVALIGLLAMLWDSPNGGSANLRNWVVAKLSILGQDPDIASADPDVAAWITKALGYNSDPSSAKANFDGWWIVSQGTTQGPLSLFGTTLNDWVGKDPTSLAMPSGDSGLYSFCLGLLMVNYGSKSFGSVSFFNEYFEGAKDPSGSTQYYYVSRAMAYYLSTQTQQAGGLLSTDDLKALETALNYGPNGNDYKSDPGKPDDNPHGNQGNMYLFLWGSNGDPYHPLVFPHASTSPDGFNALIDKLVANGGHWDEADGPTAGNTNFVLQDMQNAWGSFLAGTSVSTTRERRSSSTVPLPAALSAPSLPRPAMALLTPVSLANISAINSALASEHSVVEESSAPTASRIALRASAPSLGDAVEESSAPAARSAVHARAPSLGDSDDDFAPLDPNDNDPYSWFNPTLPNDFLNPSVYPGEDVMTRLYRMIGVMENNPGNKTMARAFLLYVSNLINGGYVKPGSDIEKYLTSLNSNGKSIVDALIDLEIKQKFFYEYPNNPNWDPTGFFNYLQSLFGGSSTLGQDAQHYIADWKSRWTNFVQSNTYWNAKDNKMEAIYTYDWAQIYASGDWGSFIQNANVSGVQHDMRMNMIDSLMRQYSANPIFLVYLLLFLLTESSSIDDLAGLGTQAKWYQKQLPVIQDLGNTWQQGKFASADDAYNWIDKIENFVARTEANPYGKDLKDSIESSLGQGGLLGMQTTYTDANGKPLTIDDLYRNPDATAKDANGKQISYKDALFNSLNSWQLDPAGSSQPSPNYGAIQNDFKSADSAFTNIASTTSTKSSQVSNSIQATDSQLKSGLDSFLDQEKAAVNNQIARGSTL